MQLFLCILLIESFVLSKTLSIIVVAGPKNRPMLKRSMRDLSEALKHLPRDLSVRNIFFIRGCQNCTFSDMDDVVTEFSSTFDISINVEELHFNPIEKDGTNFTDWVAEFYSATDLRNGNPRWKWDRYLKHMRINYYFLNGLLKALSDAKSDYFLFAEDDQTYNLHAFNGVLELTNRSKTRRCYSKIAYQGRRPKNVTKFTVPSAFGAFGTLRSREEALIFVRLLKFVNRSESEDTLAEFFCKASKGHVEVNHVSRHFGWDKKLPS
ncbi:hypothetical protein EIN_470210 [Entamoeba invadens IP1]|uniref:Uncharacterized protein n=1 Tax=Entamoeba invadens IP1 TaxID=370355 RepID=A0A0A1TUM2_ENTIV|nr:hypothetical protein EIN_470210 [Entamoeba invadens IP1]ELP83777.1 hypothetical protein EIN_470210 [Entamoeba invadens IP1]|eukprot:XP_004183123.1 hypothetical protein EIN_470210 [Entamoeba invadens IP1]